MLRLVSQTKSKCQIKIGADALEFVVTDHESSEKLSLFGIVVDNSSDF